MKCSSALLCLVYVCSCLYFVHADSKEDEDIIISKPKDKVVILLTSHEDKDHESAASSLEKPIPNSHEKKVDLHDHEPISHDNTIIKDYSSDESKEKHDDEIKEDESVEENKKEDKPDHNSYESKERHDDKVKVDESVEKNKNEDKQGHSSYESEEKHDDKVKADKSEEEDKQDHNTYESKEKHDNKGKVDQSEEENKKEDKQNPLQRIHNLREKYLPPLKIARPILPGPKDIKVPILPLRPILLPLRVPEKEKGSLEKDSDSHSVESKEDVKSKIFKGDD